jgi:hypothetical protein
MQAAEAIKPLSSSIASFLQEGEKHRREAAPEEAAKAAESYTGDIALLGSLPSMNQEQVSAWIAANKGAFGDYPLEYSSRPDFVMHFQTYAGRRWAKEATNAQDTEGEATSYRDGLWSHMDQFADPNSGNIADQIREYREKVFAGIDMSQGKQSQQWRMGASSAFAAIEAEFQQQASYQRQKVTGLRASQDFKAELLDEFEQWHHVQAPLTDDPPVAGETDAQRVQREANNKARREQQASSEERFKTALKTITEGYATVGGQDRNKLIADAITQMAETVQDDSDDELTSVDFLMWVGEQEFEGGKPMNASAYWRDKLREIEDAIFLRGKRRGDEGAGKSVSQVAYTLEAPINKMLRESDPANLEEALKALQGAGEELVKRTLRSAGLSEEDAPTLLERAAQTFVDGKAQRSERLSTVGEELYRTLSGRLVREGYTDALQAQLLDPANAEALGGFGSATHNGLMGDLEAARQRGKRGESYSAAVERARESVIPAQELTKYPASSRVRLEELRQQAVEELNDRLDAEPDVDRRAAILRSAPQTIAQGIKDSDAYREAQDQAYDRDPELLFMQTEISKTHLDQAVRDRYPPHDIVDGDMGPITVRLSPEDAAYRGALRVTAAAELQERFTNNTERLLQHHKEIEDPIQRRAAVERDLILGNPEAGVPSYADTVDEYFRPPAAPSPEVSAAPDPTASGEAMAMWALDGWRARGASMNQEQLTALGSSVQPDHEVELLAASRGGRMALQYMTSAPHDPNFGEALRDVHGTRNFLDSDFWTYTGLGLAYDIGSKDLEEQTGMRSRKAQVDGRHYPSNNRVIRMYAAAYLADAANKQPTHAWDNGDYVSDMGVDLNELIETPAALKAKYKFAVVQEGLSFRELAKGTTREGMDLTEVFGGDVQAWPFEVMHVGPWDPKRFEEAFEEWADPATRAGSRYQKAMEAIGLFPDAALPQGAGRKPGATQGDEFMARLRRNFEKRQTAIDDDDLLRHIRRPYKSYARMTAAERIYDDVAGWGGLESGFPRAQAGGKFDNRIHSPAVQWVLKQEAQFMEDN